MSARFLILLALLSSCATIDREGEKKKLECKQNIKAVMLSSVFISTPESQMKDFLKTKPGQDYLDYLGSVKCDFYAYSLKPEKVCRAWLLGDKIDCMRSFWDKSLSNRRAPKELLFDMVEFMSSEISQDKDYETRAKADENWMIADILDMSLFALEQLPFRSRPLDILSFRDKEEEQALYRLQQWENQTSRDRIRELKKKIQSLIEDHKEIPKTRMAERRRLDRQIKLFERLKNVSY